jgi:hypothetical protein
MIAGLPYTALRDAVLTHTTLIEGLIPLFWSVASAHDVVETGGVRMSPHEMSRASELMQRCARQAAGRCPTTLRKQLLK